jgi:hypothetical protein
MMTSQSHPKVSLPQLWREQPETRRIKGHGFFLGSQRVHFLLDVTELHSPNALNKPTRIAQAICDICNEIKIERSLDNLTTY